MRIKAGKRYSIIYSFWTEYSVTGPGESKTSDMRQNVLYGMSEQCFRRLTVLLREIGADAVPHSTRYLIDHLQGTCRLLQRWQCDGDVCKAGLFHSVFGTPSFPHSLVGQDCLDTIRAAIGERAVFLVRLFSQMDGPLFLRILSSNSFTDNGEDVALDINDKRAIVSLVWANMLEQSYYVPTSSEAMVRLNEIYEQTAYLLPSRSHDDIQRMLAV